MGLMLESRMQLSRVQVTVKPGATVNQVCETLNSQVSHLMPMDFLRVMAGTNNFTKSNENIVIHPYEEVYQDLVTHKKHTNVVIMAESYHVSQHQ